MEEIYPKIWELAKSYYLKGRPMDIDHVEWMMEQAKVLCQKEDIDKTLLMPLVILHDVGYGETGPAYFEKDLKKDLKKGIIGKLEKIIITSRDPAPPPISYLKVSGGIFKDMMIHDFDLTRFYLQNDEIDSIYSIGSNISDKRFNKIKDYELASCVLKSKKGVQCIITNSRHCSFGYDQRVELFGSNGMLISGNKNENETQTFTKKSTSQKKPLLNFFIDRYVDAYKLQLNELASYALKRKQPVSSFEDGRRALIIANAALKSLKEKKQIKRKKSKK